MACVRTHTAGFEPAEPGWRRTCASVRRRFWIKFKQVVAKLPVRRGFARAAYYCAFDKQTPRHVQAALLGAIAIAYLSSCRSISSRTCCRCYGFTDDAAILATAIRMVAGHITQEHRDAARAALKRGGCHGGRQNSAAS